MTLQEQADRILARTSPPNYNFHLASAACILAQSIHQMRELAYGLEPVAWRDLSKTWQDIYIVQAEATLGRLRPIEKAPSLRLVEKQS